MRALRSRRGATQWKSLPAEFLGPLQRHLQGAAGELPEQKSAPARGMRGAGGDKATAVRSSQNHPTRFWPIANEPSQIERRATPNIRSNATAGVSEGRKTTYCRLITEAVLTMTQTGHDRKLNLTLRRFGHELAVINVEGAFVNAIS